MWSDWNVNEMQIRWNILLNQTFVCVFEKMNGVSFVPQENEMRIEKRHRNGLENYANAKHPNWHFGFGGKTLV